MPVGRRCRMTTLAKSPCEVRGGGSYVPRSISSAAACAAWMDASEIYRVESIFDSAWSKRASGPTLATTTKTLRDIAAAAGRRVKRSLPPTLTLVSPPSTWEFHSR